MGGEGVGGSERRYHTLTLESETDTVKTGLPIRSSPV